MMTMVLYETTIWTQVKKKKLWLRIVLILILKAKKRLKIQQLTISFSCLKTPEITMCSTACQYEVWVYVLILASKYICIRYMYLFLILTGTFVLHWKPTHPPYLSFTWVNTKSNCGFNWALKTMNVYCS